MLLRVFTLATVVFACLFAADASALDVGYDEYADYAVRKALRLVIDSSVGTRLGLQRMPFDRFATRPCHERSEWG